MASVQAAPGMTGPGQLPGNLTKEMVQQVYHVRALALTFTSPSTTPLRARVAH